MTVYPAPDSGEYSVIRRYCLGPEWWAREYRTLAREARDNAHRMFRLGWVGSGKEHARQALRNWQLMRQELRKIENGYR